MHETITRRIVWVAKCTCDPEKGLDRIFTEDPPRECQCLNCNEWITPKQESYTGQDKFDK